jgi:hypothetical protein
MIGDESDLFRHVPERVDAAGDEDEEEVGEYKNQHFTVFARIFDPLAVYEKVVDEKADHGVERDGPAKYRNDGTDRCDDCRGEIIAGLSVELKHFVGHGRFLPYRKYISAERLAAISFTIYHAGPFIPVQRKTSADRASAKAGNPPRLVFFDFILEMDYSFSRKGSYLCLKNDSARK